MTTNQKIAELIQKQTYDERLEFAQSLAGALEGMGEDDNPAEYLAPFLSDWAEDKFAEAAS